MWHKSISLTAVVAAVVALGAARLAEEIHEGKVTAVGEGKISVLDNRDDDNDTFAVTSETKITRNGKSAKLSDVQVGDKAKVTATAKGDALVATSIAAVAPE